ncbi:RNA polymerase sigma-70 factor [Sphingobacterium paucimobilis]|nr:RNA polymerase sigma-70 factor [Sphingobacterium paucimobilis]
MIIQLQNSEEEVMWRIFDTYWESLFLTSFNIVKNRSSAEDIVQETLITIWDKRLELAIQHSLKAYLFSVVRYASYKEWRRIFIEKGETIDQLEIAVSESLIDNLIYKDLRAQINKVVESLPIRCKEVYILSREKQLSHKEISQLMNISTKTVENQLTKALRILRKSLANVPLATVLFQFLK